MDSIADNASGQRNLIIGGGGNNLVQIHSGTTGLLLGTLVPIGLGGTGFGNGFGHSVATVGDQDGDGQEDILVGAPLSNGNGQAFLFSGSSALGFPFLATISPTPANTVGNPAMAFGWSVSRLDDLNGTGSQEFAIGAPHWTPGSPLARLGLVEICTTDPVLTPPVPAALATLFGSAHLQEFGYSITTLRKLGGLTTTDPANFAVGSPSPLNLFNDHGAVEVFSGLILSLTQTQATIWKITPIGAGVDLGHCLSATDTNADNQDDVLTGLPNRSNLSNIHRAQVQFGAGFQTGVNVGFDPARNVGWSISECGAFDASPGNELLVGAPDDSPNPSPGIPGHAFILSVGGPALVFTIVAPNGDRSFGKVVSEVDTSLRWFAVAAPTSGRVFLFH